MRSRWCADPSSWPPPSGELLLLLVSSSPEFSSSSEVHADTYTPLQLTVHCTASISILLTMGRGLDLGPILMGKNGFAKVSVFAKIFEKNADTR